MWGVHARKGMSQWEPEITRPWSRFLACPEMDNPY